MSPFALHMAKHLAAVLVIPALLLISIPYRAARGIKPFRIPPLVSWLSGVGAMAFWHIPPVFRVAETSMAVHVAEQISLLAGGTLFWWPVLAPLKQCRMRPVPQAIAYLISACFACTMMGIFITFSRTPLYVAGGDMQDQQIGGLLMWVPGCLIYLGAVMAMLARWYAEEPEKQWT